MVPAVTPLPASNWKGIFALAKIAKHAKEGIKRRGLSGAVLGELGDLGESKNKPRRKFASNIHPLPRHSEKLKIDSASGRCIPSSKYRSHICAQGRPSMGKMVWMQRE